MAPRAVITLAAVVLLAACGRADVPPPPTGSAVPVAPARRAAHTATPLTDGTVLVAGGCVVDGCGVATDSVVVLDGATARPGPRLHQARDAHTATALPDGRVLVVGGFAGEGAPPLRAAEVFDPRRQRWDQVAPLAQGRGGHVAAALGDGTVLVAGGWVGPRRYTAGTELFDLEQRGFRPGPALPEPVDSAAAVALRDGTALVTGGQTGPGTATRTATLIAPGGRLVPVAPLGRARFKHAMVELPGGDVLVIGGTSDDRTLLASTEIYDPRQRRFRPGPRLRQARYKLSGSAAVLPDGRVLVAGGGPGVEVLDPARRTSRPVGGAGGGWASFSTVSVVGDAAWVLGGYDRGIALTGTDRRIPLRAL